jgi:hypothetical protein
MALQGNLRDFSATEILQLLGMQKKTGCLVLEQGPDRARIYVHEGRIVSTRAPGMEPGDPLLAFLTKIHRLSEEQQRGIATIQRETGRDLVDLMLNGRYVDPDELELLLERHMLDEIARVVEWDNGGYRFEISHAWTQPIHVRLGVEGALIESARRVDETKRFAAVLGDPDTLLGVRDLPDPEEPLSEEERELFGIIDGRHTVAEVIAQAPLSDYEARESLDRMLHANWIERVGRRESVPAPAPALEGSREVRTPVSVAPPRHGILGELAFAAFAIAVFLGLMHAGRVLHAKLSIHDDDVFVAAQIRDVRYALELFKRERGHYPGHLDELVSDRWVSPAQIQVPGHRLVYHIAGAPNTYDLRLERAP